MPELPDRETIKAAQAETVGTAQSERRFDVPVVVDRSACVTGCHICVESCPVDCLAIDAVAGKAYMKHDDCWYCLACELDCPNDAITVKIPLLVR
jgi:NAD-dependent dihydropyrimidine dehydrogenase PreA subunit